MNRNSYEFYTDPSLREALRKIDEQFAQLRPICLPVTENLINLQIENRESIFNTVSQMMKEIMFKSGINITDASKNLAQQMVTSFDSSTFNQAFTREWGESLAKLADQVTDFYQTQEADTPVPEDLIESLNETLKALPEGVQSALPTQPEKTSTIKDIVDWIIRIITIVGFLFGTPHELMNEYQEDESASIEYRIDQIEERLESIRPDDGFDEDGEQESIEEESMQP